MDQPDEVTAFFADGFAAFLAASGYEACGPDDAGAIKWRGKVIHDGAEYNATRYGRPA